jgi:hypothetical protein
MDLPIRRESVTVEHVISTEDRPLDFKEWSFQLGRVYAAMGDDGISLDHDDAFFVEARDGEIVFSYKLSREKSKSEKDGQS